VPQGPAQQVGRPPRQPGSLLSRRRPCARSPPASAPPRAPATCSRPAAWPTLTPPPGRGEFAKAMLMHEAGQTASDATEPLPWRTLVRVAVTRGVPFVGFGFCDNFIMVGGGGAAALAGGRSSMPHGQPARGPTGAPRRAPRPPPLSQPRPGGEPPPAHPSPAACPARRSARWPTDPEAPPTPTPHTHTHPTHTCPAPPQILAGEEIDATFGVSLGLTTMAAAGLGNLFADVAGISIANSIEVGRAGRALQARGRGQGAALARLRLGASAAPKPRPSLPPPACRSKTCGGSGTSGTRWCPRARAAPPRSRVSRAGRAGPLPQPGRAGRRLATMRLAVPGPLGPLGQCSCRRRPAGLPACPGRHLPCSPDM
jgi:hypothetical protein